MRVVTAAIILRDGRVLLAQRDGDDPLAGKWEFPGGKLHAGETEEECLKRELEEEFEIVADVGSFLTESVYDYGSGSLRIRAYWASWDGDDLALRVHRDVAWVDPQDLATYDLLPADVPIARLLTEMQANAI